MDPPGTWEIPCSTSDVIAGGTGLDGTRTWRRSPAPGSEPKAAVLTKDPEWLGQVRSRRDGSKWLAEGDQPEQLEVLRRHVDRGLAAPRASYVSLSGEPSTQAARATEETRPEGLKKVCVPLYQHPLPGAARLRAARGRPGSQRSAPCAGRGRTGRSRDLCIRTKRESDAQCPLSDAGPARVEVWVSVKWIDEGVRVGWLGSR